MQKTYSIIIADDDTVFPFGLKVTLLKLNKKYDVRLAMNGKQVIDMIERERADMVFMDYNMPILNGVDTALIIKKRFPETKIIACTYYQNREVVAQLLRAGIDGYLLKEARRNSIEVAVDAVINGANYYSDEIKKVIQDIMASEAQNKEVLEERRKFTDRELEIIELICEKYSNKEIAVKLFIEVRTVETHLHNIYKETGTHNHSELKKYADDHHLFPPRNF